MATYSSGKKWFDYEFKVSNLNLNQSVPIREQWDALNGEERYGEYIFCCEAALSIVVLMRDMKADLGIWEGQWKEYRSDLMRRFGFSVKCKKELDAKRQTPWHDMTASEQWETFYCFLEWLEILEGERQELLRLKEAQLRSVDPEFSMPYKETGYKYETI